MKKFILVLSIFVLTACGNSKSDLIKKVTKEDLSFHETVENLCDTDLEVNNELNLTKEKNEEGKYKGNFTIYDCGDGSIYMTLVEGTYTIKDDTIKIVDQYNNKYNFKVKSKNTVAQLDDKKTEVRTFKLVEKETKKSK